MTVPFYDWPAEWREAWTRATRPSRLRYDRAPAARWSEPFRRRIERGIGRYLAWLGTTPPLIDEDHVDGYIEDLVRRGVGPISIGMLLQELEFWARLVWRPDLDWQWLEALVTAFKRGQRSRRKTGRTVPSRDLWNLGRKLMRQAEAMPPTAQAAIRYRDGLVIAMLASRPIRRRNIAELTIGESLVVGEKEATLKLASTKNGHGYVAPLPDDLLRPLRRYLAAYRPILLGDRPDDGMMWIGRDGGALRPNSLSTRIRTVTARELGRPIPPQLFRDCLATSAMHAGTRATRLAPAVLGHSNPHTQHLYYQHGKATAAAAELHALQPTSLPPARRRSR